MCDALGNPTPFYLIQEHDHDLEGADALIDHLSQAKIVLAYKAFYADERMREKLQKKGCQIIIPSKNNRLTPSPYDKDL